MKQCAFETCDRDAKSLGLCAGHYGQQHLGKPLTPLKPYQRFAQPTPTTKICTKCLTVKNVADFYVRTTGRLQSQCKECMIAAAIRRQREDRDARVRLLGHLPEPRIIGAGKPSIANVMDELERSNA